MSRIQNQFFCLMVSISSIVFTIGCSSMPLINHPITHKTETWSIVLSKLDAGPDTYSKFLRNYWIVKPTSSVAEKIMTGIGAPKNPNINPQYSSNGFIWLSMKVRNLDKYEHNFDFSRVRLISDHYVINPEIIDFTEEPFTFKDHPITKIKPGKTFSIILVFEYTRGHLPSTLIYDNTIAGRIFDKIVVPLPVKK